MNDDHAHDSRIMTHIEADRDGQPCFGCYFGAVFDSLRPEQLNKIAIDPEEDDDPQEREYARRFGATLAYLADGIAAMSVNAAGPDAQELLEVFLERLNNMVVLMQATPEEHPH
jgi:hypothetical protein